MIRVAIFDDNQVVLDSFTEMLRYIEDMETVGLFSNATDLEKKISAVKPDVVVMDIDMPFMKGTEATAIITSRFPQVKVLIQSVMDDDSKVFECLCNGASGYILKGDFSGSMEQAIRDVWHGGSPMSPGIASKVIRLFRGLTVLPEVPDVPDYSLTTKELEILGFLVEGLAFKQIADQAGISFETVRTHVKHIYQKMHVASKSEAVAKAIRQRLV